MYMFNLVSIENIVCNIWVLIMILLEHVKIKL